MTEDGGRRPEGGGRRWIAVCVLIAACKGKAAPVRHDAGAVVVEKKDAAVVWDAIAALPRVEPRVVIELPSPAGPLASIVGPVVVGDLAVVGTSALGFVAIDWRAGQVAWRRGAGAHLAPPMLHEGGVLLVGDCERAPVVGGDKIVVGCWRAVSIHGVDLGAGVIAGARGTLAAFAAARGGDRLEVRDAGRVAWARADAAIEIDLQADAVKPIEATREVVIARHKDREWRIAIEDEALIARDPAGKEMWRVGSRFAAVLGVIPGQGHEVPMVRVASLEGRAGKGLVDVLDIDATGSKRGQAGTPVPGIAVLGHAFVRGDTALAVRLDTSLAHDYVTAHEGRGALVWVWPLPERPRADPVGLAITDDAVIVFHDGDRLAVLPRVSHTATIPGPGWDASKNATP